MKRLVERLKERGWIFRELRSVDLVALGYKKRWGVYIGVDTKGCYVLLVHIARKSRFLRKDAEGVVALERSVRQWSGHGFKKRYTLLDAPLCSKAKEYLQEHGWIVDASV